MNTLRRFVLFVKGQRAAAMQQDDDDRPWPWWADDEEDPSFRVIREEARRRASDDLQEAMAKGEARPQKRLGVITTSNMGGREAEGPAFHSLTEPEPRPATETLRDRWRRWSKKKRG